MNGFAEGWFQKMMEETVSKCKVCGGRGNIVVEDPEDILSYAVRPCQCKLKVQRAAKLVDANVPTEFWRAETDLLEWNNSHFHSVCDYAKKLKTAKDSGMGYLMVGENGVGKTFSGCHILSVALSKGYSAGYITATEYMHRKRESWKDASIAKKLDKLLYSDFLVLDEVGKEHRSKGSDWVTSEFDALLRARRGHLLPTIVITNLTVIQFKERYGVSLWSILRDRMEILQYMPGDWRIKKK